MAKNYFDLGEYDRAAHFLESSRSPEVYFLYMYSRYLSGEKKRLDDSADAHGKRVGVGVWGVKGRGGERDEEGGIWDSECGRGSTKFYPDCDIVCV